MTDSDRTTLEKGLWSVLDTLGPYRDHLVLIGGWVPYLHLRYGGSTDPDSEVRTSLTAEADLLVSRVIDAADRPPLAEILRESGFHRVDSAGVVWAREPEHGETIEFLQAHRGPAASRGQPAAIPDQSGIQALSLDHLWIQEEHTTVLALPSPDGGGSAIEVRVPVLSAFLLNKANTFNLRGGSDGKAKGAKDLLYLRDVMAAGAAVQESIAGEMLRLLAEGDSGSRISRYLRRAAFHIAEVSPPFHEATGAILAERDGFDSAAARADVEGHLMDFVEMLREAQGEA